MAPSVSPTVTTGANNSILPLFGRNISSDMYTILEVFTGTRMLKKLISQKGTICGPDGACFLHRLMKIYYFVIHFV